MLEDRPGTTSGSPVSFVSVEVYEGVFSGSSSEGGYLLRFDHGVLLIARSVVAVLFMATQTLYAGYLMDVCLRCVFGHRWVNIPNTLPASSGTTSRRLLAFFILCESSLLSPRTRDISN